MQRVAIVAVTVVLLGLSHPPALAQGTSTNCMVPGLNVPISAAPRASGQEAKGPGFVIKLDSEYGASLSHDTQCGNQIVAAIDSMPRAAAIATVTAILPPDRAAYGFTSLTGTWVDFLPGAERAFLLVKAMWAVSVRAEEGPLSYFQGKNDLPQSACVRDLIAGHIKSLLTYETCIWNPVEAAAEKYRFPDLDILRARVAASKAAASRFDRGAISREDEQALVTQAEVQANSELNARHPPSPRLTLPPAITCITSDSVTTCN